MGVAAALRNKAVFGEAHCSSLAASSKSNGAGAFHTLAEVRALRDGYLGGDRAMTWTPRPRVCNSPTVYLDFDGVLHPQDVWLHRGEPYVRSPSGHLPFEHADVLISLLQPYPSVRIVLSTSWVRRLGYLRTAAYLPQPLRDRCVGATWHRKMGRCLFDNIPRGEQALEDVARRTPSEWLALDDDTQGWRDTLTAHLIAAHPVRGLCDPDALKQLRLGLKRFAVTA